MSRELALFAAIGTSLFACNAIWGVDDLVVAEPLGQGGVGGSVEVGGATDCLANQVRGCYEGSEDTREIGTCKEGTQTCLADGSGYDECIGQVLPALDDCMTRDDDEDCNGLACGEGIWSVAFTDNNPNSLMQEVFEVDATDEDVVVVGRFIGAMRIGAFLQNASAVDEEDGFVAKVDANQSVVWLTQISGDGFGRPHDVARDSNGNIYVTGVFNNTFDIEGNVETSSMGTDAFVVKLDEEGQWVWTRTYGGASSAAGNAIAINAADQIAVVGDLTGNVDFGTHAVAGGNTSDGFTLVLDPDGNELWVESEPSTDDSSHRSVAITDTHVFAGGIMRGDVDVGAMMPFVAQGVDGLVMSYDLQGGTMGARPFSGPGVDVVAAVAAMDDEVIVAGDFAQTVTLGVGDPHTAEGRDGFVARYSANLLNVAWATTSAGAGDIETMSARVDADGEIAVVGAFTAELAWGPYMLSSAGMRDIVVAKLDASGAERFANAIGGAEDEVAFGLAIQPISRQMFVGGTFNGEVVFVTNAHTARGADGFVALLGP